VSKLVQKIANNFQYELLCSGRPRFFGFVENIARAALAKAAQATFCYAKVWHRHYNVNESRKLIVNSYISISEVENK